MFQITEIDRNAEIVQDALKAPARLQCKDMTQMGLSVQMPQEGNDLIFSSALFQRPDDVKNPRLRKKRWGELKIKSLPS